MMPTFPSPPLKFRTAGFPRYGLKAGISDEAFPAFGFAIVLRAVRPPSGFPCSVSGTMGLIRHLRASGIPLYPRGPRSGPGYAVPVHPHLTGPIRPTRRHIPTSPHGRFIRDVFAVPDLHRPRRPTSGSELSSMLFRNMSSSTTTGNSSAACTQYFTEDPSLQLRMTVSAFPSSSHSDPGEGTSFRGLTTVRLRYDLLFC